MLLRSTDRLMLAFCRLGDPRAIGKVFDRTAPELLRLAIYLAGDRNDAEDLLQRTFLAAIESRASYDPRRRALPWLIGILANHARRLQRERSRRRDHQVLVDSQSDPESDRPEAVASKAELSERIARLRAELGAPYAEVLELHLEEGWNCKEIAERLGRPEGTVRTQLVRGRELLKKRLPGSYVAAVVPLLPDASALAAIKARVLVSASHLTSGVGAAATTTTIATGGIMMSKKLLLAVSVALLLVGSAIYSRWPSSDPAPPAGASNGHASSPVVPKLGSHRGGDASGVVAIGQPAVVRQPVEPLADADPGFGTLRVEVRWQDGRPAANIGVGVKGLDGARNERRSAITSADGTCVLHHLRVSPWLVTATHVEGNRRINVQPDTAQVCIITATETAAVHGRVLDGNKQPVADAEVWIASEADWQRFSVARSDSRGRFKMPLSHSVYVGAQKPGFVSSLAVMVDPATKTEEIVLELRGRGCRIEGTVRDAEGQPIAWARVHVGPAQASPRSFNGAYQRQLFAPVGPEALTDENGRYALLGLAKGKQFVQAWAAGTAPSDKVVEVVTTQSVCDFTLTSGAVIHGQVRDASDRPVAKASVGLTWQQGQFIDTSEQTDNEGRFRITGLPAGSQSLTVKATAGRASMRFELAASDSVEWNPELLPATMIRGQVLLVDGRPMSGVTVGTADGSGMASGVATKTKEDGTFALRLPESGPVDVRVGKISEPPLKMVHSVNPGTDLVIRLTPFDIPSAMLRGRVVDDSGRALVATIAAHKHGASLGNSGETAPDGRFLIGPQPAGRFMVRVTSKTHGSVSLPSLHLQPDEDRDLGDIVMHTSGQATVTVHDDAGKPTRGFVALYNERGGWVASMLTDDGRARFPMLQPGRYLVSSGGSPYAAHATLDVLPAAESFVDLHLKRVGYADVTFEDPNQEENPNVQVFVFAGEKFAGRFGAPRKGRRVRLWLPPGHYSLELRAVDGRTARTEVTIRDFDDHPQASAVLPRH